VVEVAEATGAVALTIVGFFFVYADFSAVIFIIWTICAAPLSARFLANRSRNPTAKLCQTYFTLTNKQTSKFHFPMKI
jgi:hypothetical protein